MGNLPFPVVRKGLDFLRFSSTVREATKGERQRFEENEPDYKTNKRGLERMREWDRWEDRNTDKPRV